MYSETEFADIVRRDSDGAAVPRNPDLLAWQEYQAWLAAGNTPTPCAEPSPTAPQSVTPVQAFTALDQAGQLAPLMVYLDAPGTPPLVRAVVMGATEWRRDSLMLMAVAIVLGLSPEQVDALFVTASGVSL